MNVGPPSAERLRQALIRTLDVGEASLSSILGDSLEGIGLEMWGNVASEACDELSRPQRLMLRARINGRAGFSGKKRNSSREPDNPGTRSAEQCIAALLSEGSTSRLVEA
jgi:hypothetical protein